MKKINSLSVVILLFSIFIIREMVKVESSNFLGCSYGKNIMLDSSFYTSYAIFCLDNFLNYQISLFSFLSLLTISFIFWLFGDKRIFSLIFSLSFLFLIIDILEINYQKANLLYFFLAFPFMFFSACFKLEK